MNSSKTFPPGAGWIPLVVALVVVLMASMLSLTPQFDKQVSLNGGSASKARKAPTKTVTVNGKKVQVLVDPNTGQVLKDKNGNDIVAPVDNGSAGTAGTTGSDGTGDSTDTAIVGADGTLTTTTDPGTSSDTNNNGTSTSATGSSAIGCDASSNGGATAPGVTANSINVASTVVTEGVGKDFLGEAQDGIKAAIDEVNAQGGICGRRVNFTSVNSGWDYTAGGRAINSYASSGNIFALVGEPDSEGLRSAIDSGTIQKYGIPVVGTDGMLADQYHQDWVWPVAASTVTNAHIIAKYAYDNGARKFGIVYDTAYAFGKEGADAFKAEIGRLSGASIGSSCTDGFCGIDGKNYGGGYSTQVAQFNGHGPYDAVLLLLEPAPAETWMSEEYGHWENSLYGGEPLFDDKVANQCPNCGQAGMRVWTGYRAALQPFDSEAAVNHYKNSLPPSDDPHNEFTEGAYLGTRMFLEACKRLGAAGTPLTRDNLKAELDSDAFDLGLSQPLQYPGLPHIANSSMAMFAESYSGSFNGWSYQNTDFIADPARGSEQ